MNICIPSKVDARGRIIIPASVRKNINLNPGDIVFVSVINETNVSISKGTELKNKTSKEEKV